MESENKLDSAVSSVEWGKLVGRFNHSVLFFFYPSETSLYRDRSCNIFLEYDRGIDDT